MHPLSIQNLEGTQKLTPQNFRSVFFLVDSNMAWLYDRIPNLQVTALAAEKRVRRKRKASGFDRADVKGWVAMRGDTCVLTVKKRMLFFQ